MSNRNRPTQDFRDFVGIFAGLTAVGSGVFTALTVTGIQEGYALSWGLVSVLFITSSGFLYLFVRERGSEG